MSINTTSTETFDFTYLLEKDPTEKSEVFAEFLEHFAGVSISPRDISIILATHGKFQRSDFNKNRMEYRARSTESIYKGASTLKDKLEGRMDIEVLGVEDAEVVDAEVVETSEPLALALPDVAAEAEAAEKKRKRSEAARKAAATRAANKAKAAAEQ